MKTKLKKQQCLAKEELNEEVYKKFEKKMAKLFAPPTQN